jgi:hypothetical protein
MTRVLIKQRHLGHSVAVCAQRLGILSDHSSPRQRSAHWLILSCQALALVCLLFANRPAAPWAARLKHRLKKAETQFFPRADSSCSRQWLLCQPNQ